MEKRWNRRLFVTSAAWGAAAGVALAGPRPGLEGSGEANPSNPVYPGFPRQDLARVRETVGASHGNFKRVQELVTASPALAKATYDWGFGDWESALGAASHTGNRDIALFLIENGARPTLFSAAMLGQLAVVRAFVEASPGVQSIPGPHGIPLIVHAKLGGEPAASVVEYLESVGGASGTGETVPLDEQAKAAYLGTYVFGPTAEDAMEVYNNDKGVLMIRRGDQVGRGLTHLGNHIFHPAGASAVRIVFAVEGDRAAKLTILDPEPIVIATRRD